MDWKKGSLGSIRALFLFVVVFFALASPPLLATDPLVDPPSIAVPAGLDSAAVRKAIRMGGLKRQWIMTREDPGKVELALTVRKHVAKVQVLYDKKTIQISYLDSTNLDYRAKKGVPHIHSKYLKWVNNLVNDVSVELQAAEVEQQRTEG